MKAESIFSDVLVALADVYHCITVTQNSCFTVPSTYIVLQ